MILNKSLPMMSIRRQEEHLRLFEVKIAVWQEDIFKFQGESNLFHAYIMIFHFSREIRFVR